MISREKITATIITFNEERNIEKCLKSILWADEILVVDSYSTDKTIDICKRYKCRIIQTDWQGFGRTKHLAVESAKHDWILSIDADEVSTEELRKKIELILEDPKYQGYNIKRRSHYLNREVKYCGWDRDYPLRLFDRRYGNFNDKEVHESVLLKGNKIKLEESLLHFTYPNISAHIGKMNRYTDLALGENNSKASYGIFASLFFGLNKFLKMYVLNRGFLDGKIGFLLCVNSAFGVYLKYIKLWRPKN